MSDPGQERETKVVWVFWFSKDNCRGHVEWKKEKRWETICKSGQGWTLQAQLGRLKTGQDGKGVVVKLFMVLH